VAKINPERMQILTMLQEGKISVSEAERLLDAIGNGRSQPSEQRFLRLRVLEQGQIAVNLRIPLELVQSFAQVASVIAGMSTAWETVASRIEAGMDGRIVEFEQPNENRKVEILVE